MSNSNPLEPVIANPQVQTVVIDGIELPYRDARGMAQKMWSKIVQEMRELPKIKLMDTFEIRGFVILDEVVANEEMLDLAGEGVALEPAEENIVKTFEKIQENLLHMKQYLVSQAARRPYIEANRRQEPDPIYDQNPPWFDQNAYDERVAMLSKPWNPGDAWKYET